MPDEHEEPAKRSKRWVWAVAVPVLYVLSIGPLFWVASFLMDRFGFDMQPAVAMACRTIYAPVMLVADRLGLVSLLGWYLNLFG